MVSELAALRRGKASTSGRGKRVGFCRDRTRCLGSKPPPAAAGRDTTLPAPSAFLRLVPVARTTLLSLLLTTSWHPIQCQLQESGNVPHRSLPGLDEALRSGVYSSNCWHSVSAH